MLGQILIPLHIYEEDGYQRVGIHLSLGNSDDYHLYLLDTGSQPLIVNSQIALGDSVPQNTSGTMIYGATGSDSYTFNTYPGTVKLRDIHDNVHSTTVQFGALTESEEIIGGGAGGILGAGPAAHLFHNTNPETKDETPTFNLFSILGQIEVDSNLMKGFTIRFNGDNSILTVGITQEYWLSVPEKIPMQPAASSPPYPNTGAPTWDGDQIAGEISFSNDSETYTTGTAPIKIDSGAPEAFYVSDTQEEFDTLQEDGFLSSVSEGSAKILGGTLLGIVGTDYLYAVNSGTPASDVTVYEPGSSGTYAHFNTGINIFHYYEITFLLDDGTGTGYVGLRAIPEPSALVLASLALIPFFLRISSTRRRFLSKRW